MSWVWIGQAGVGVDIFLPAEDALVENGLRVGWVEEPGHAVWEIRAQRRRTTRREAPVSRSVADESESPLRIQHVVEEALPLREEIVRREAQMDVALPRRFESSADVAGQLAGVPVRGEWIRADHLGPATHEVLLGVLAHRLPE